MKRINSIGWIKMALMKKVMIYTSKILIGLEFIKLVISKFQVKRPKLKEKYTILCNLCQI